MEKFEKASKMKLRFDTDRGFVTTEDLWDIPLRGNAFSLDNIASNHQALVKQSGQKSFVEKKSTKDAELVLKFDIIKSVIDTKLAEEEQAEIKVMNKAQKEKILDIIADKEDDALAELSVKDLRKMAKKL